MLWRSWSTIAASVRPSSSWDMVCERVQTLIKKLKYFIKSSELLTNEWTSYQIIRKEWYLFEIRYIDELPNSFYFKSIWAASQLWLDVRCFSCAKVSKTYTNTHSLLRRHHNKSQTVPSDEPDGQLTSSRQEITRPINISRNKGTFARVLQHGTTLLKPHIVWTVFIRTITLQIDSDSLTVFVFLEVRSNHTSRP